MEREIKIRSSIRTSLKRKTLLYGTFLAALGLVPMLYAITFLSIETFQKWGIFIFGLGLGLITLGLLPYRRLCRLETQPEELLLKDHVLQWNRAGKKMLSIPVESIERIEYIDSGDNYGIAIVLKNPIPEKVVVHNPKLDVDKIKGKTDGHLFFPLFSERGCNTLKEELR